MNKNRIVLYFGSFNPIHNGHLTIADYMIREDFCEEVWFVVSPNNPLKKNNDLLDENDRLNMAKLAVGEWHKNIKVCDLEFSLSKPSYTINTLRALSEEYSDAEFFLLMGEDNIFFFEHWKLWIEIINRVKILIYPRRTDTGKMVHDKIRELCEEANSKNNRFKYLNEAPLIHVSSTDIREKIKAKESIDLFTAKSVSDYIKKNELYEE